VYRRGHDAFRSSGQLELDAVRYLARSPMPFRARINEIDESTLKVMLHGRRWCSCVSHVTAHQVKEY
jgi:hypothetical protein